MSLYRIKYDGLVTFVEASRLSRAEEAWLADVRSEPDNADFNEEPDSIELLSIERVVRDGDAPCPTPTPSGASADTIATVTTHQTPDATPACSTPSDQIRGHSTSSAPPQTEEPEAARIVRSRLDADSYQIEPQYTYGLLAAYDAERAHHARTTQTLCTERAALTIERARVAKIAAILSDDTLENPQKIGRALRVAEGQS